NPLQTAILNLFVALRSCSHNLVVGTITRESISKALQNGISAEQVSSSWYILGLWGHCCAAVCMAGTRTCYLVP
ncbi:hypothetical protein DFH09DRAFT_913384, partial [Mycena vulgaris]